jgi:hypothetical protein
MFDRHEPDDVAVRCGDGVGAVLDGGERVVAEGLARDAGVARAWVESTISRLKRRRPAGRVRGFHPRVVHPNRVGCVTLRTTSFPSPPT